ncbi:hypothetical protein LM594_00130 [Candidatus Caldipriscus sp.]|nr:hypothetical protein [Candidatus Caldipriscus sp.]
MKGKLDELALKIHLMGLGTPAIFFLESIKPLRNLTFNFSLFIAPFAEVFLKREIYEEILNLVKDEEAWDYLIKKLEDLEDGLVDGAN